VTLGEGEPHEVKDHSTEVSLASIATDLCRCLWRSTMPLHCFIHFLQNFLKQMKETSDLLGEYINLYQIHSATFESGILTDKRVHEALSNCRDQRGWTIGLSVSSPQQSAVLRQAMTLKSTRSPDKPLFDSVQCTFNLFEQRPREALLEAHSQGMDVIIKEGLANGRVLRHPLVLEYAKKLACQPDQLALGFILAQPFEPRVLSGAVTPEQLESNLKAIEVADKLRENPSLLEEIANKCVVDSEEYWAERSALAWN
jgi:aryl-alcohol dehydrogenase-like predicted oxidoreductase